MIIGSDPAGGKGRGVVSTCSYEARAFGIHSAMPIGQAYRRCPGGIFLRPRMEAYEAASQDVFEVFGRFTPDIEPVSIDEAFLDMSGSCHLFGTPREAALQLKVAVREGTGLVVSVGIAPNKMVAKIASDLEKPDGLVEVPPGTVLDFLWPLSVGKLWGVGPQTLKRFHALGIRTVGDLALWPAERLGREFGSQGRHLHALANGIDDRPVERVDDVKSISHEETFPHDVDDQRLILDTLLALSERISRRLRQQGLKARSVVVRVRRPDFETFSHGQRLDARSNHADEIYRTARAIFLKHFAAIDAVRLIGVRVADFDDGYVQDDLFVRADEARREAVHQALDRIHDRFGEGSIFRGRGPRP